jgi:hypothetical protein
MPTSPETNPDFIAVDDILPEQCVPLQSLRIVKYLDEQGVERFNWHCEGEPSFLDMLGLLEGVKFDVMHRFSPLGHGGEDDEEGD